MITAVVSGRMGSSRLPGKVLFEILGRPMLSLHLERVRRSRLVDKIVVATSIESRDDAIAAFCEAEGVACFRGNESDVLDRVYRAALHFEADPVVRLTGDDPLADPQIIDKVLSVYLEGNYDYVANVNPPTFPDGLDVEVVRLEALERVWREASDPEDREHVTRYIRRRLGRWRTANLTCSEDLSDLHWAVDTAVHFEFVRGVFETLYPVNAGFTMQDVLALTGKETSHARL